MVLEIFFTLSQQYWTGPRAGETGHSIGDAVNNERFEENQVV